VRAACCLESACLENNKPGVRVQVPVSRRERESEGDGHIRCTVGDEKRNRTAEEGKFYRMYFRSKDRFL
jgi:hypothetical protein